MKRPKSTSLAPGAVLTRRQREQLELEVVSREARLALTRLLRRRVRAPHGGEGDHQIELGRVNRIVNAANSVMGRPLYVLELSDWDYEPAEYAWHYGELEAILRRPDTPQLMEILADLVDFGALTAAEVNAVLDADGVGAGIEEDGDGPRVVLKDLADLPETAATPDEHANVRKLIDRVDHAMQDRDWSLVLHTAASVFETTAKQVVPNPNVQNQSLGGWFSLYRKHSALAAPLLDAIEAIFQRRNIEPLAGHGSVADPSITEQEAVQGRIVPGDRHGPALVDDLKAAPAAGSRDRHRRAGHRAEAEHLVVDPITLLEGTLRLGHGRFACSRYDL
jgi:hypothetical protein